MCDVLPTDSKMISAGFQETISFNMYIFKDAIKLSNWVISLQMNILGMTQQK